MEKLLERQIENVDSLNYAKANHSHSQYLERDLLGSMGSRDYAARNYSHSQYAERGALGSGLDYAARNHTHDYASRNHSHDDGFGGFR